MRLKLSRVCTNALKGSHKAERPLSQRAFKGLNQAVSLELLAERATV